MRLDSDELSDEEEEEEEEEEVTARPHAAQGRERGREGGRRERREGAQLPSARGEGRRADERRRGTDKEGENQSTNNNKVCDGRTDGRGSRGTQTAAAGTARRSARGWSVGGWVHRCLETTHQGCLCGTPRYDSKSRPGIN